MFNSIIKFSLYNTSVWFGYGSNKRTISTDSKIIDKNTISTNKSLSIDKSTTNYYRGATHFGHKSIYLSETSSWHPSMAQYHLGIRNDIAICNLQQTQKCLSRAFYVLNKILENGGNVLIVNTNPEFYKLSINSMKFIEKNLPFKTFSLLSYCFYKWIGGTLTNYKQISKSIYCYIKFSQRCSDFCEKNNIDFTRYQKIKKCFQGYGTVSDNSIVMSLQHKPDIIFLFNPSNNQNLILEANRLQIPIIGCTDTSSDATGIAYPIPCNNTSVEFTLYLYKKLYKVLKNLK